MNLEYILNETIKIVKSTSNYIKSQKDLISPDRITEKNVSDYVTEVDKKSEELLVSSLIKLIPEAGFITEEETINKISSEYNWIIDPIDGTTNFIHSIPIFSISIALQYKNEIIMGVVYEINNDECFYSIKGGKAFLNGKEICVSKCSKIQNALVANGFPYKNNISQNNFSNYIETIKCLAQTTSGLRRLGSAAVDLAYVAAGRFDAYFEYGLKPYDMAAGMFLVSQSGGVNVDFKGSNNYFNEGCIIATNMNIHKECSELIIDLMNK